MYDRIVVGWAESASADAAVAWAMSRAESVPVSLVHVVPGRETGSDYLSATSDESQARVRLMAAAEEIRRTHPFGTVSTEVRRGALVDQLLAAAPAGTLLVLGGRAGAEREGPFGWSVGARIAASHLPGSVAIVPRSDAGRARTGVVVGYDGTPEGDQVVEVAIAEASGLGQELHIVHAWLEPPAWQDVDAPELGLEDSLEAVHHGVLDTAVRRAGSTPGLEMRASLVHAPAALALVDAARDASEVVVGNHGSRTMGLFILGSVSHIVVRELPAPVLVVRS